MDTLTPAQRSERMSRVRGRDTMPEMIVRRMLHRLGYRYRLHRKDLPGKPDIVFPGRKKVVFVHGCYWHGHGCRIGKPSKSNVEFWTAKIDTNRARDSRNEAELRARGWDVLVVWQCELQDTVALEATLVSFLGSRLIPDPQGSEPPLRSSENRDHHDS